MRKSLSFGKAQASVLVTLLILISLGACYFFIYLPNNENNVQERRFRCLRKIDGSIRKKIATSQTQITNLLNYYDEYSHNNNREGLKKIRKYISEYPKTNFVLLLPEQANKYFNKNNDNLIYLGDDTSGTVKYFIDAGSQFTLFARKIGINNASDSITDKKNINDITIGIRFEFGQFVKPLLLTDVFTHYIVFIDKKKIYEDYPTGLTYEDPDSLLNIKSQIASPGLRSLQIGETDYKVFSQPVYTYTNSKWIIAGLLKNSEYQKEKNQLPLWVLLLLITAAVSMLVSLPWIKLYHMGNKDRLTTKDAIASVLVSIILMSLLFFVFFKYRIDLKEERLRYTGDRSKSRHISYPSNSYSRDVLATKITNAFKGEINIAYNLLSLFDTIHQKTDTDVYLLGKGNSKYDTLFKKHSQDIVVKQVYWLDNKGSEKTNLTIGLNNDPKGNYSERSYFKMADGYKIGNHKFFLDQVLSFTDGTFKTVISKRGGKNKDSVVAMSLTMKSLDNVVMPDGYQFAIINSTGLVLYHTKPNRNLFENFKTEFADNQELLSCLEAKSDTTFQAEYYGKLYNVKIKPIPDLPYFTVIFEDREYNDMRDTEAYTFTFSMLICMLVFLIIKYSIVFFVSSKHSFFKKQHFDTSWIGPHIKSHHQYNLSIISNLLIILMLIIFFNYSSFLEYLYILLISTVFTSLFLNGIFIGKYKKKDLYKYRFKKTAILLLFGFTAIIDIVACYTLTPNHIKYLFLYELLLIVIYPIISLLGHLLLLRIRKFKSKLFSWTFTHSYALMGTTRLIISSGISVAFFFIYSYNYEQGLDTRYRQLQFAKALLAKNVPLTDTASENKKLDDLKNNLNYASGIYFDGLYINKVEIATTKPYSSTNEDILTAAILSAFRIKSNDLEAENNNLNLSSVDGVAHFNTLNKQCGDSSPIETYYQINADKYIKVSSLPYINYTRPNYLFWTLLLISVLIFYYMIHHIVRRLFALNVHRTEGWGQLDFELLKNNEFNKMVLIVGSPGSNTLLKLKYKINSKKIKLAANQPLVIDDNDPSKNNVFVADMMMISPDNGEFDADWKNHKQEILKGHALVIINHFEYNIKDVRTNKIKLDLIELLIQQNTSKVIIISTMHPLTFLDSFDVQNPIPESELGRWHVLLGNFRVVIDPLINSKVPAGTKMPVSAIMEETKYSRFLHRMQQVSLRFLDEEISARPPEEETTGQVTDSLIFKLQLTSQYFYMDIWQSLTREEKFILYDLAEDGLVNSSDDFNLSMLICKGLIIKRDGVMMLFNKSFRNFILTAIGEKEMNRIKQQVRDNGKWGNLKTPMNIAILAILVFLFASQHEAYSRVITYITAFGAAIPAVLKVFSMFGSSSNTQKAE